MDKIKVLFVDDEVNILSAIKRSIIDEPIQPLFAVSGEKALEYFSENTIAVIVSDMKMPTMNGLELLKRVKELSPSTVRIVLSGYNQLPQILATVNSVGVFRYITKPWDDEEDFLPAIGEAVKYYNLVSESEILKEKLESKNRLYEKGLELNKNLVNQMSKSIGNIKNVSKLMIKLQNTYLENLKNNISEIDNACNYNKLIGDVYINYLNKSLVDKEKFFLSRFKKDLAELLVNNTEINVGKEDLDCIGDYKLIKFITVESINFLTNKFNLNNFEINIKTQPVLNILIKNSNVDLYNSYISDNDMKFFYSMIDQILLTMGGKVTFYSGSVHEMDLSFERII